MYRMYSRGKGSDFPFSRSQRHLNKTRLAFYSGLAIVCCSIPPCAFRFHRYTPEKERKGACRRILCQHRTNTKWEEVRVRNDGGSAGFGSTTGGQLAGPLPPAHFFPPLRHAELYGAFHSDGPPLLFLPGVGVRPASAKERTLQAFVIYCRLAMAGKKMLNGGKYTRRPSSLAQRILELKYSHTAQQHVVGIKRRCPSAGKEGGGEGCREGGFKHTLNSHSSPLTRGGSQSCFLFHGAGLRDRERTCTTVEMGCSWLL